MSDRIRPLKSIRTKEEYEDYKKYLERYLSEYKLFQKHGEKLAELMNARKEDFNKGSEARAALEQRARLIENDEYANALERNITAYMLTITEYEAKAENRSLIDVIRGIITRDEDTKDYLKRRYMKSRAEDNGLIQPVNLSLQDPYDCVRQIFEECDFINIPAPELSLVPIDTEVNKVFTEVRGMLQEYLKENEITAEKEHEATKSEEVKAKSVEEVLRTSRVFHEVQTPKNDKNKETSFEIGE